MEASFGNLKKSICLILSLVLSVSMAPIYAGDLAPAKSTHKLSVLWERYDDWSVVLGTFKGKVLVVTKQSLYQKKAMFLDIETGIDLWENVENDFKTFVSSISYIGLDRVLFDVSNGILITNPGENNLVCYKIESGKKLWERKSGDYMFLPKFIDGDVAYENTLKYYQYDNREYIFTSYNVVTGKIISELKLTDSDLPKYFAINGYVYGKIGNYFVLWDYDHVVLFDPAKKEFKHLITTDLIPYDDTLCVFGNIIVVNKNYFDPGNYHTKVVAVNADTGKEIWSHISCGITHKLGKYAVFKRKVNDVCELVFVEPGTGKIMQKFSDKSVDYIWRTLESGLLVVSYEYKLNKHKSRYVIRAFDDQLKEVFCCDSDMSMLSTNKSFNFSTILDQNHILLKTSKISDGKKTDGFICAKFVESGKAAAKLDQLSNVNNTVLLYCWQNLSVLANIDENKTITSISCIDALTGQNYWSDNQNKLSQVFTGKKPDELKLSCHEKWICFYKFENGARSAMACFNIETGKLEWENKKLKDFVLPVYTKNSKPSLVFTKMIAPDEPRIFTMSLNDGSFAKFAKLDGQKKPFEIVAGTDQRTIVFDGTLAMHHFRTGYQAWRLKTVIMEMDKLKQSFIYGNIFVRPGTDDGKTLAITGCDLYMGKTKWFIQADSIFGNTDNLVLATTGFETKSDKTFIVIDINDGKTLKTAKLDSKEFESFKIKQMFRIADDYLVLAFKPGFGSRIISFDDGLNQTGQWDFEGKEIVKSSQWLGCISLTFVDPKSNQSETISYRLNN
jgi:outer membrane protein assembly factor BamB